ncbi:thiazole synthase [Neorickettsia sennetsu]|uniref:Thiazole synthase n=1 Tax=Ehrlichia sennetsu (strain ATCC VR-367 / Miyayama) TaxID=222891 RepID=THIG_EHRS3|nr:thiazole synthase [Neorickettsia sennetsu]Q2GDS9.1 RecName: Full=Thiazole synthase [Neorickettsia sennetsu str. Miyayama]ABD46032.1 thiamin biosynthesis ThiG [Neorickettsia sennetsu str. Miyayama]
MLDHLEIAGRNFSSRLIVGTGKYKNFDETVKAIEASGAEVVTVALKRVNITDNKRESLQDYLDPKKYTYLPNTAFCFTAGEAVRHLALAREIGGWNLVKVEVFSEKEFLYPDMRETLKAVKILAGEGFHVMPYCNDDPIMCKRLEESGAVAIMPLAAPIGSGLGIQNLFNLKVIVKQSSVPVIVDAGVGTPSDAVIAMEAGCDGVLINTSIAKARFPVQMAKAMKHAVRAGRLGYLAGRMLPQQFASPSSNSSGIV